MPAFFSADTGDCSLLAVALPSTGPQHIEFVPATAARVGFRMTRCSFIDVPLEPSLSILIFRPSSLWGAQHGVNEWGLSVSVLNHSESTWTLATSQFSMLSTFDVTRLLLERSKSCAEACEMFKVLHSQYHPFSSPIDGFVQQRRCKFVLCDHKQSLVIDCNETRYEIDPVGSAVLESQLFPWITSSAYRYYASLTKPTLCDLFECVRRCGDDTSSAVYVIQQPTEVNRRPRVVCLTTGTSHPSTAPFKPLFMPPSPIVFCAVEHKQVLISHHHLSFFRFSTFSSSCIFG